MAYIRATYNVFKVVSSVEDDSTLATNYTKYWDNQHGVEDSPGVWCTTTNKYIPDQWHDDESGWLCPDDQQWSAYDAIN